MLSDFSGADENPLREGGNWYELDTVTDASNLRKSSGGVFGTDSFVERYWTNYWTPLSLTGDIEVWGEVVGTLSGNDRVGLHALTNSGGANVNHQGYVAYVYQGGASNRAALYRYDNWPNGVLLDELIEPTFLFTGDLLLFRIIGDDVEQWWSNDGGANWTQLTGATDTTYRVDYQIALAVIMGGGLGMGWTSFGGGYPTTDTTVQLPYLGVGP